MDDPGRGRARLRPPHRGGRSPGRRKPPATGIAAPPRPCSTCRPAHEPEWYGLYVGDKKVGLAPDLGTAMETRGGKRVRVARQEMLVEAMVGQRQVRREVTEERVYEAGRRGRLLSLQTALPR